jgi:proteasome assembly chaperone (PAC2) family protein
VPATLNLHKPWLVAVWPGMGHVALNAGVYLLSKLEMTAFAEFQSTDLFDVDHVEVKEGIIQAGKRPKNRFFLWQDPHKKHDLVVFVGEAQPPAGKFPFCRQLMQFAKNLGVERVFTFAAMATRMNPSDESKVYAAATDEENLDELKRLELEVLEDGNIGGLNGVLLSAAVEAGLHGACLLGEMPHIFAQLPFPKASQAILEVFATIADVDLDLDELAEKAREVESQLDEILARVESQIKEQSDDPEEEPFAVDAVEEPTPQVDRTRIDKLLRQARTDRSKAFELKQELDRLGLFKEYEDRFLDLFKKPAGGPPALPPGASPR